MPSWGKVNGWTILLMDHDGTSLDGGGGRGIIRGALLIVVHHQTGDQVPDLDAEFIHIIAAADLAIKCSQHEAVNSSPIDGPGALVLSFCPGYNQPIISSAAEVETGYFELELGVASGDIGTLLIS